MDPKTILTAAILATMGVENCVRHKDGHPHSHIEAKQAVCNSIIGITFISGMKITEFADHTYSYELSDI